MDPKQDRQVDVVVVGAGLAGLTAAVTAAQAGRRVDVVDVRSPGGRARSDERDSYVLNQGPHALFLQGAGRAVLGELGIATPGAPPPKTAHGLRDGRLFLLPTSAPSLVRSSLLSWRSKAGLARVLATLPRVDPVPLAPFSAASWIRSTGLPDDAVAVLSTLLRLATYAPDLEVIAADAAVAQLQMAQTGGVSYLHGGWTRLVDSLVDRAAGAGARIATGRRAVALGRNSRSGLWELATADGRWLSPTVVLATGSPASVRALLPADPGWTLGEPATAACLDLGLRGPPPTRAVYGLGPLYLSTHAPAARLAPEGAAVVHVMRYGARSAEEDRADLWALAGTAGIGPADVVVERFLHRMVVTHAVPVPGRGLAGRPTVAVDGHGGLFVAGDWVGPRGLLADASLASGQAAGRAAAEMTASMATPDVTGRQTG